MNDESREPSAAPLPHGLVTVDSEGALLRVRANAAARRNAIRGVHDGALRVSVTQAPERGRANQAIAELLSEALGIRRSQTSLVSGATDARKLFRISGVEPEDLKARIARIVGDSVT